MALDFVWRTKLLFYGMPWLLWDGRQALLFDLEAQRFHILGPVLYPQDLVFPAALLVLSALALFFFTAVAGRLWCGYTCPQTVYTEIFMWVERRFEGDRIARMRLDQAPWSAEKLARKVAAQSAWVAIGLFTGFSFVGYFTPIRELSQAVLTLTVTPWNSFWILFYGAATRGNAGCPTGIDIRDGLQNECIGCAACIDVCNDVMDKMDYPKGVIRCSTENGVAGGWSKLQMFKRTPRPRVLIYGGLLPAASVTFAASVVMRSPFQVDVVKDLGALARVVEDGAIESVYRLQIMNRAELAQTYRIGAEGIPGLVGADDGGQRAAGRGIRSVAVSLRLPFGAAQSLLGQSVPVHFEVKLIDGTRTAAAVQREESVFFVPR